LGVFVWKDFLSGRVWLGWKMEMDRAEGGKKKATKNLPAVVKVMLVIGAR
jgi:hypothetical protein